MPDTPLCLPVELEQVSALTACTLQRCTAVLNEPKTVIQLVLLEFFHQFLGTKVSFHRCRNSPLNVRTRTPRHISVLFSFCMVLKSHVERPISFLIRDVENQTLVKTEKHEKGGGGGEILCEAHPLLNLYK